MSNDQQITLYSTGCPRCEVLKTKLHDKGIQFREENSVEKMLELGISQVPVLCVNGTMLEFADAVKWVNAMPKAVKNEVI